MWLPAKELGGATLAAARCSCCLHTSFAAKEMLKGIFALCLFNKSKNPLGIFFLNCLFIYFCLPWGLHCFTRAFSNCGGRGEGRGLIFDAAHALLIVAASVVEQGSRRTDSSSWSTWSQ